VCRAVVVIDNRIDRQVSLGAMASRFVLLTAFGAAALAACAAPRPDIVAGRELSGRVVVEWIDEDQFIYRKQQNPLVFVSSRGERIVPTDMYTDGGSIPQAFRGLDGLSPWGLGPAYIVHDYLFYQYRCGDDAVRGRFTFEDTVRILGEVALSLQEAGLIKRSAQVTDAVVFAVSTPIARALWERPRGSNCAVPPPIPALRTAAAQRVSAPPRRTLDLTIPAPRARR
jgi:hypothetical protein